MKGVALALLVVVLAMVQFMARPSEAISCGQVDAALAPCLAYLTQGGSPSSTCCSGVKNLMNMTPNQQDRRAACECVKAAASQYSNLKPDAASNLPGQCGVQTNVPISPNTNCQSVP